MSDVRTTQLVPCARCGGDGEWSVPYDIDRRDGGLLEHYYRCDACDGTGEMEIPLELADEDEIMAAPL